MFEKFFNAFSPIYDIYKFLKVTIGIILIALFFYFQFGTKSHLVKYDGIPCQGKIFSLDKPMERVIGGESTTKKGYYYITKNLLEYTNSDYLTVTKTGEIYTSGSKFKVISYYNAFDSGPLSELGGGGTPHYLVRSLDSGHFFWIAYFEFDAKDCKISDSIDAYHFDVKEHIFDKNISETIIK